MIIQRTNTILYCERWAETVAFYRDILNFRINHQTDWFVEFQLTPHAYLSVANANRATIDSVDGQGITLSWQVDDVQKTRRTLLERQVKVSDVKSRWGSQVCYAYDPEGHRIEFWQSS